MTNGLTRSLIGKKYRVPMKPGPMYPEIERYLFGREARLWLMDVLMGDVFGRLRKQAVKRLPTIIVRQMWESAFRRHDPLRQVIPAVADSIPSSN